MSNTHTTGYYFAPPSHWPVVGSAALFMLAIGAVLLFNSYGVGWLPFWQLHAEPITRCRAAALMTFTQAFG